MVRLQLSNCFLSKMFSLLVIALSVEFVKCEIFSSITRIKELARESQMLVPTLDEYITLEDKLLSESTLQHLDKMQTRKKQLVALKEILDVVKLVPPEDKPDELPFAAHPINAFVLIKALHKLQRLIPYLKHFGGHQRTLREKFLFSLPDHDDVMGSAQALIRIQSVYNIPTRDMVKGKIFGHQAVVALTEKDMYMLATFAESNEEWALTAQWLIRCVMIPGDQPKDVYVKLARAHRMIHDYQGAQRWIEKAEKEKAEVLQVRHEMTLIRTALSNIEDLDDYTPAFNVTTWRKPKPELDEMYEALCRGEYVKPQNEPETADLICRYKPAALPYVVYKEEILSRDPRVSLFYEVISDHDTDLFKQVAAPKMYRSKVGADVTRQVSINNRVSQNAWLWDFYKQDKVALLSKRVSDITGLDTTTRLFYSSAEAFQVLNYGVGGHYDTHTDYFRESERQNVEAYIQDTGDRLATFLIYLSDVEYGGTTVFPYLGLRLPVIKKAATFWYNARPSGEFDPYTSHAACPVVLGEKWVMNKWIREYGQEFRKPCALEKNTAWDI